MSKFKVGDRVETRGYYSFDPGVGTVVETDNDDLYFVDIDGEGGPGCHPGWAYCGSHLVAVAPTITAPTLTIQSGKFYKTRDGRKVGPMESGAGRYGHPYSHTVEHDFATGGIGKAWRGDGTFGLTNSQAHPADLIAEWADEPVASATATFKAGDNVRRPGHLTGTVLGVNGNEVRIDYGVVWGEHTFSVAELELVKAAAEATTIKVGDWVRTEDGEIGIVLHDDGSDFLQFKVGYVGNDEPANWDWFANSDLTIVPPGTAKASNDNAPILAEIDELEQRLSDLRTQLAA